MNPPAPKIIRPYGELNVLTFEKILNEVYQTSQGYNCDQVTFDLSKLRFIRTGGMVNLLGLFAALSKGMLPSQIVRTSVRVVFPEGPVAEFLHRFCFFRAAGILDCIANNEELARIDDRYFEKWRKAVKQSRREDVESAPPYVPLHYIAPPATSASMDAFDSVCSAFLNDVIEVFDHLFKTKLARLRDQRRDFYRSQKELYENIYRHSDSWGIVTTNYAKDSVSFSVLDLGIGITKSLANFLSNFNGPINDATAIMEAVKKGVTSKEAGGLGLYFVKSFIERHGGSLAIRTGSAMVLWSPKITGTTGRVVEGHQFPGTQVNISLPLR